MVVMFNFLNFFNKTLTVNTLFIIIKTQEVIRNNTDNSHKQCKAILIGKVIVISLHQSQRIYCQLTQRLLFQICFFQFQFQYVYIKYKRKMGQFYKGVVLILMMFGHNFVLNQPQSMQEYIQDKHQVNVEQFNLLYSLPSAIAIIFIIPLGVLYDKYSLRILLIGATLLIIGQIIITLFSLSTRQHAYQILIGGRVLEGVGAEVLYMIQGHLASTWMGKLAGLIYILPQVGEVANAFGTPLLATIFSNQVALYFGLFTCFVSTIACLVLYYYLKKKKKQQIKEKGLSTELDLKSNIQFAKQPAIQLISESQRRQLTTQSINQSEGSVSPIQKTSNQTVQNLSCLSKLKLMLSACSNLEAILKAGKVFWLTIAVCAVNQCLYFPFMDNANLLLQKRFSIPYEKTGLYLGIPFISAIIITAAHGEFILHRFSRRSLIFVCSLLPFFGHSLIYLISNQEGITSFITAALLIIALSLFGMGIGSYYSVSFPAVGYAVPQQIRGTAYACLCFFQTISMTLIPIITGKIITVQANASGDSQSYKKSSILFIVLCLIGVVLSYIVYKAADEQSFKYDDFEDQTEEEAETNDQSPQISNDLTA